MPQHVLQALVQFQVDRGSLSRVVDEARRALTGIKATIDFQLNPQAAAQVGALTVNLTRLTSVTNVTNQTFNTFTASIHNTQSSLAQFNSVVNNTNANVNNLGGRFGAGAIGLGLFTAAIRHGIDEAKTFAGEMVRLVQVADAPASAVRAFEKDISRLSTSLGVSSLQTARSANVILQAGYSLAETKTIMEGVAKASLAPNFKSMDSISEVVISLRQFGLAAKDMEGALGSINAVSGATAVEADDLAKAVRTSGGAAKAAGMSFEELLGTFTSVRATTRESAESIATGLKTIFSRLQRADTVDQLKDLGIELRHTRAEAEALGNVHLEGQFVGGFEAVKRLSGGLGRIPTTDPRYSQAVEALGGTRQLSRVLPLLSEFSTAQKAAAIATAGKGSIDIAAAQAQDAYSVKLTKVREQVQALIRSVTESKGFDVLISGLEGAADAGTKLVRALGPLLPILAGLAAYRLGGAMGISVGGAITRGRALGTGALIGASAVGSAMGSESPMGGALTGGAAGAFAGSMLGPWGAAVGGAIGAVAGFKSALDDASTAVKRHAIDSDLTAIGHKLTDVKAGENGTALASLNELVGRARGNVESLAADKSTGFFGFNAGDYQKNYGDGIKKDLGPFVIGITEALARQAEIVGKRNAAGDPAALGRQFGSTNAELLKGLAAVNGQTVEKTLAPFLDMIKAAQTSAKTLGLSVSVEDNSTRLAASLARLVTAVDAAGQSVGALSQRGNALAALTDGHNPAGLAAMNANNPDVIERLLWASAAASAKAAGRSVKKILPGILAQVAGSGADLLDGDAIGTQIRHLAAKTLGSVNPEQSRALDAVVESVSRHKDIGEFRRSVTADPNKAADEKRLSGGS